MTQKLTIDEEEIEEEFTDIYMAHIFEPVWMGEPAPEGSDVVLLSIDGKIKADLDWAKERQAAIDYIDQGRRILWKIDLGLFDQMDGPLSNQTQFLTLCLSLEHFRETLWKEFRQQSTGLCLYRGDADFSQNYPWDEEQKNNLQQWLKNLGDSAPDQDLVRLFCRDVAGEYLDLLAARLPDTIPLFVFLDATSVNDPLTAAQLITKERYPRFHIGVKGLACPGLGGEVTWTGAPLQQEIKLGVCLPYMSYCRPEANRKLKETMLALKGKIPFRVIPAFELNVGWEGLDTLIVDSGSVDSQLRRKLMGFCAAGGAVLCLGPPIGLSNEADFQIGKISIQYDKVDSKGDS